MKKRLTLFFVSLFLCVGAALAQTKITGTVLSQDDGQPIIGAAVQVIGTQTGSLTDVNGKFTITLPAGKNALKVSYLGFEPKEVIAKNGMRIFLKSDAAALDEVVVVGYGSGRKVGTVVGSVTTVRSEKLSVAPSASALDALQGQVAGLNVLTSSGESGDNAVSMNIHGIGSLGASSTPLYVIDGIPSSSRTIMAMNPNDIESVTVLKDASATSIYGSRAANGVIYVTTKSGKFNSDAKITFRTQYGRNTLANKGFYEGMMNASELRQFWIDAFGDWGVTEEYLQNRFDKNGYTADTKWYEVLQNWNAVQTQNDISIEGGGEKVKYMIGASQFHQDGTTVGNYYDRYTARANVDGRPKDWLKVGVNVNLSYDKRQRNSNWGNSDSGNANYLAGGLSMLQNPLYPQYDEDGNEYNRYPGNNLWNPVYYMNTHPDQYLRYGLVGNAYVEISPIKNLKIMSRIGTDMYFVRDNWMTYPSFPGANGSGTKGKSMDFDYSNTITNTIEYKFNIANEHNFTVLGGMEGVENNYDYFYARSNGQDDDRLMNLQNGLQSTYAMSESSTKSKFLSFFGRLDYNFQEKYFVDASIRNDACSRFGVNNRNATFWSAGAMWKISKENFLKDYKWINDLNVKVSYGTQGNASIGDYAAIGRIGTLSKYNDSPTWAYTSPGNPNLTWEKQKLLTIGVSGRLFNFMDFDVSYYVRKTSDMLMGVPYAYTTGFEEITENVGTLQNKGIDIELNFNILKGKDYYLNFRTIFNYNSQKITELFQGRDRWQIANTGVAYVVGSPVMFYYPVYAGVDPADGAPMWYVPGNNIDENHEVETTKDFDEAALEQNTGKKRYPPINGGFSITGGWKGLSIAADFSYVLGKYLINNDAYFYQNPGNFLFYNTSKECADFWTPENTDAKFPCWTNDHVMQFDTHLLENASFMRLKNLQIGYDFPKKLLGFQNVVKGLKITLTGRNLWTITNYGGIDPEVNSNLTLGKIGNSKQYLIGAEITF